MPLEFESISHGPLAFGFFNIETDLVLLNQYFFFANDFCHDIVQATEDREGIHEVTWDVYRIEESGIGNLMGAIYGMDHRGFIGEVYKLFPFPNKREAFKQNPDGFKTRSVIEKLIQKYGELTNIPLMINPQANHISIGEFVFNKTAFQELIKYIWVGGFPRWKDEIRPEYVMAMKKKIEQSKHPLVDGLTLE